MLVLSRKLGERLVIGDEVVLIVNKIAGNRVTLAIEAPNHVRVVRGELSPIEIEDLVDAAELLPAAVEIRCSTAATVAELPVLA